ncbi:MAG: nucleotidyltransferase domain-containing protein [Candidatus Cloacimonetes bacterium]|nr:nucleotidyltransferase domain-containing protein [Candidatus Cloacimonadota bacterium]
MVKRTIIEAIKRYIALLNEEGFFVEKTYLFGSYLNNTETADSDIDLLIVADRFDISNDYLIGKIWALTKKINSKIEPYVISSEKFYSDDSSPLIQLVKQEGLEIA